MDTKKPGANPWENARIKPASAKSSGRKTPDRTSENHYEPVRPPADRPSADRHSSDRPSPDRHGSDRHSSDRRGPPRPPEDRQLHARANLQPPDQFGENKPHRSERMPRGPVNVSAAGAYASDDDRLERSRRRNSDEVRIHGRNACLAAFARRPQDLRKVYLVESRMPDFKQVLSWCVKHRLGYRVVENDDLDRLTDTQHHEGVCFEMRRQPALSVSELLQTCPPQKPALLVWLDGVGNPHNVGAILRSAANFGVQGMILPAQTPELSGAALRVAEGGAESVRLACARAGEDASALLHAAGFKVAGTVPRDGMPLYDTTFPQRLALVLGAEGEGMSKELIRAADLRISVPGTGAVESLNVSASAAVLFGEFWRQHPPR